MATDQVLILGCCAGGSALGYAQAGIVPIGFEINPRTAEIAKTNLGQLGAEIHIEDYQVADLKPFAGIKHAQFSFPCQGFSVARKGKNLKPREDMDFGLTVGVPAIELLGSSLQTVVLENVRAWAKSKAYRAIVAALHRQGFHVASVIVDMSYHNCPQSRERVIVVAAKEWLPCFSGRQLDLLNPEESTATLNLPKLPRQTWWDALHGRYGGQDFMPQLEPSKLTPRQHETIQQNPQTQLIAMANSSGGYCTRFQNEPSFTLTCDIGSHNALPRIYHESGEVSRLNIPHLARLATFPDWWQWGESRQVAGDAIGDCITGLYEISTGSDGGEQMKQPNWNAGDKIFVTDKKSDKFQQFGLFVEFKQMSTGLRAVVEFQTKKEPVYRSFLLKQIRYFDPNQVYKVPVVFGWYGSLAGFWTDYKRCRIVDYPNPPYTVGYILEDSAGDRHFVRNIDDLKVVEIEQERMAA